MGWTNRSDTLHVGIFGLHVVLEWIYCPIYIDIKLLLSKDYAR